jgi:hypothetical protein
MGATGGQFLDIAPPDLTLATIDRVIHQKTASGNIQISTTTETMVMSTSVSLSKKKKSNLPFDKLLFHNNFINFTFLQRFV